MTENNTSGFNFFAEAQKVREATEDVHLISMETGEPVFFGENMDQPIIISVLSKDSAASRSAALAITNRRIKSRSTTVTAEQLVSENYETLAKMTVSWQGIADENGPLECTFANAKSLYSQAPDVKEQVENFIAERANFLGKS